jgi:hypothetical protein
MRPSTTTLKRAAQGGHMKTLVVGTLAILAIVCCATPAIAHVVEVITFVSMASAGDDAQLEAALVKAVETVLRTTIAFAPTLVALTEARTRGDRLYVRLLIADADGEATLKDLTGDEAPALDRPTPNDSPRVDLTTYRRSRRG